MFAIPEWGGQWPRNRQCGPVKKYRFRKMYFHCNDKRVIDPQFEFTTAFQHKEYADRILEQQGHRTTHYMYEDATKPLPVKSVEGFYLVPEKLFEEVLKRWVKE
jgi:hypothetical protein